MNHKHPYGIAFPLQATDSKRFYIEVGFTGLAECKKKYAYSLCFVKLCNGLGLPMPFWFDLLTLTKVTRAHNTYWDKFDTHITMTS